LKNKFSGKKMLKLKNRRRGVCWTRNNRVNIKLKLEDRLSKVEKNSTEIIKKYHYQCFGKS